MDKRALAELTRDRYVRRIIEEPEYLIVRRELDGGVADAEKVLARQPQSRILVDLPRSEKELREAWFKRWTPEEQQRVRMALRGLVINPPKRGLPHGSIARSAPCGRWVEHQNASRGCRRSAGDRTEDLHRPSPA